MRVENDGDSSIEVENDIFVNLRGRYGRVRQAGQAFRNRGIRPVLFVRTEGDGPVRQLAMTERQTLPVELEPEERCEAVLRLKDLLPELVGVHRLHLRAWAGRTVSEPLRLEMDFGRPRKLYPEMPEMTAAGEVHGPFRKIPDPWRPVRRFVRRYPVLSSLLLLAALLPFIIWTAARVRPRSRRDGLRAPGAAPATHDHGETTP